MWNKIFPIALAVAVVVMAILTYLAYSQLQSAGFAPNVIAADYLSYDGYFQQFLALSSIILLVISNILLWTERKSWALWITFLYFAFFVLIQGWWLGSIFADYKIENSLDSGSFYGGGLLSAVICVIAAVGIFFDQFIVLRLKNRMHPLNKPIQKIPDEMPSDKELIKNSENLNG